MTTKTENHPQAFVKDKLDKSFPYFFKEKSFNEHLAEYKGYEEEKAQLFNEKDRAEVKIQECAAEIKNLEKQQAELDTDINNSASLLLSGKRTPADVKNKRQELFCLMGALSDQEVLSGLYQESVTEWPRKWRELREKIQQKERDLQFIKMHLLANEVANKCSEEIKEMAALVRLLPNYSLGVGDLDANLLSLGALIMSGVCGGTVSEPGYPDQNELELQLQKFNKEINA